VGGELTNYAFGTNDFSGRNVTATVDDTSYLHVVLDVSNFTTARRYPQIKVEQGAFLTTEWLLSDSNSTLSTNQPTDPWVPPVIISTSACGSSSSSSAISEPGP
jgi:hypothetical protein